MGQGWGDGSVGKALALQMQGPEFNPMPVYNPTAGEVEAGGPSQ